MNAPVTENDLELIETYLDGELSEPELQTLRRRLDSEPALAVMVERLSHERQVRHVALCALESETGALGASIGRALRQAATREVVWSSRLRITRHAGALAACLLVGIAVGWFGHSRTEVQQPGITLNERSPSLTNPNITTVNNPLNARLNGFNVAITDDFGRVLAQQRFDTLNEARQFSNDLVQWQNRQRQVRNGEIRLIGDDF